MGRISIGVQKEFCDECSLALRRFIGKTEGVESIEVEDGKISIVFDGARIEEKDIVRLTRESIEKLGYRLID